MNGINYTDYSGTTGASAQFAAPANTNALNYSTVTLQNVDTVNFLYYTTDGSAPVADTPGSLCLGPKSSASAGQGVIIVYPVAGVKVLGSAVGTKYTCKAG